MCVHSFVCGKLTTYARYPYNYAKLMKKYTAEESFHL